MGTVFQVPWACWPKQGSGAAGLADFLRQEGFLVASMALARDSVPISHPRFRKADRLAVVLGNEERGISPAILDRSDLTVRIPMHHGVDSLNVAAASALAFWAAAQRADEGC